MKETHHFNGDLNGLNAKRSELERSGFVFKCDRKDGEKGRANIMTEESALTALGAKICILTTRGLIDLWVKDPDSLD